MNSKCFWKFGRNLFQNDFHISRFEANISFENADITSSEISDYFIRRNFGGFKFLWVPIFAKGMREETDRKETNKVL